MLRLSVVAIALLAANAHAACDAPEALQSSAQHSPPLHVGPVIAPSEAESPCEDGWVFFQGSNSCYKHMMTKQTTWQNAEAYCVAQGSHLASINSKEESLFLLKSMNTRHSHYWDAQPMIGLFRNNKTQKWEWTDGSQEHGYAFAPVEKDNKYQDQGCSLFIPDPVHNWNKAYRFFNGTTNWVAQYYCWKTSNRYICKKRLPGVQSRQQAAPVEVFDESDCEVGWVYNNDAAACYKHVMTKQTSWQNAEAYCVSQGGHLASINTKQESLFLANYTNTRAAHYWDAQPMIGLFYNNGSQSWEWTDGSTQHGYEWSPVEEGNIYMDQYCSLFLPDPVRNWNNKFRFYNGTTNWVNRYYCWKTSNRYICKISLRGKPRPSVLRKLAGPGAPKIAVQPATSPKIQSKPAGPAVPAPVNKARTTPLEGFNESDLPAVPKKTTCAENADKTSDGKCQCKKGNKDILDTDIPEKVKYEKGTLCIPDVPCANISKPMTILFIIDSSGSIGSDWPNVVKFVESAATQVPKNARVGFVKFSSRVTASLWLNNGWTLKDFVDGVPKEFDRGLTNTPEALEKATEMMATDKNERKVAILITDGLPQAVAFYNDKALGQKLTLEAALKLRAGGIKLIAMGIGRFIVAGEDKVKAWVADPVADYFGYHQAASMLTSSHMANVLTKVCEGPKLSDFIKKN